MLLCVRSITYLAEAINGYGVVDPRGRDLPRFAGGAHIAVRDRDGRLRDYSLWNDAGATASRYCPSTTLTARAIGTKRPMSAIGAKTRCPATTPASRTLSIAAARRRGRDRRNACLFKTG